MDKTTFLPERCIAIAVNHLTEMGMEEDSDIWNGLRSAILQEMIEQVDSKLSEEGIGEDHAEYETRFREIAEDIL